MPHMRSIEIAPAMAHHHHLHQHSSLHHHQQQPPPPPHLQQNFHHSLQFHPPPPPHLLHQLAPPDLLLPPPQSPQQPQPSPQPILPVLPPPGTVVDAPSNSPSHYSLRWNNHQSHILAAFDALLQAETLVDVTLVCAETSVRAHKVVLSACSPFFQRIFSENPCKHPVIVLKDFNGWEVQAIVDFMYKGEISVGQEQLQDLIHAAESLQIRGLVSQDHIDLLDSKARANSVSPTPNRTSSPVRSRPASPSLLHHQQQQQQQDFERNFYGGIPSGRFGIPHSLMTVRPDRCSSPFSPITLPSPHQQASPSSVSSGGGTKLPHMPQLSFPGMSDPNLPPPPPRIDCHSPIPRRKQARPRRRSGEMSLVCQNIPPHNNNNSISSNNNNPTTVVAQDLTAIKQQSVTPTVEPEEEEEVAENLSMKKPRDEEPEAPRPASLPNQSPPIRERTSSTSSSQQTPVGRSNSKRSSSPVVDTSMEQENHDEDDSSPLPPPPPTTPQLQSRLTPSSHATTDGGPRLLTPEPSASPELDLSLHHKDFMMRRSSSLSPGSRGPPHGHHPGPPPPPHLGLPPNMLNALRHEMESHSPLHFPPMPSVSALTMTQPHSKFFGLDSPLGLFPPGLDGCRNPLLDMADHRSPNDPPMFVKKKMGRPKGQHSAPRGGPPRSWTNAELTEALQHVWNKKMTTSQASRIFGIPYNSLLMYVRGKYGKSLKLEQLRRDCIGGPIPLDHLMGIEGGSGGGKRGHNNNNMSGGKRSRSVSGGGEERGGPGVDHPDRIGNSPIQHNTRPSSVDVDHSNHPLFNPFGPGGGFYPDFGPPGGPPGGSPGGPPGGFPLPVNMMHLLPQGGGGEGSGSGADGKNRSDHPHHHSGGPPGQGNPFGGLPPPPHQMSLEEELSQHQQQLLQQAHQLAAAAAAAQQQHHQHNKGVKDEEARQDLFSAMAAREREERSRELMVHQNGQD